jgi:hypothetical protein
MIKVAKLETRLVATLHSYRAEVVGAPRAGIHVLQPVFGCWRRFNPGGAMWRRLRQAET